MARILHLETTTNVCSVCLSEGGALVHLAETDEPNAHARVITLQVAACLKEAGWQPEELDAVSVSQGPGSYTGMRVGASAAKGLCYALELPLIAVDTLKALASAAREQEPGGDFYCSMIDARRMEVYQAIFDPNLDVREPVAARILEADSFDAFWEAKKRVVFCGNGAEKCSKIIESEYAIFLDLMCSSSHLISLAEAAYAQGAFADLAYFEPIYVKSPYITRPKPKL